MRGNSRGNKFGKFVRRNRRAVLTAGLAFTLIVGLVVFFTARLARAEGLASMRKPGDLSAMAMLNAFLREWAYRARRRLLVR